MKVASFLIGILILASCAKENSADVNQQSIYTIYELFYDEGNDVTTARATFRFGGETGTLLQLTDPAYCNFNGESLVYQALTGVHKKDYAGLTGNGTFVYGDQDNNIYTNAVGPIDPIGFPSSVDSISKSAAFNFIWTGNPVNENETVTLTIANSGSGSQIFTTIVQSDSSLVLSASKLDNLGTGWKKCTLKRSYNSNDLTEGTNKGGRVSVWYTISKNIYIKP